ncbi:unnamed protein product [Fusarium fujikuroi]|nr:unnamed protein product [Fusarium fujikuroi]
MQLPTTKSLHRLSIEHPWFAVHPLLWTSQHLRLLGFQFQHLDSALPPSTSSLMAADKILTMHSRNLANIDSPVVKSVSVGHLLRCKDSPLEKVNGSPPFTFAGRDVHSPDCDIFQVSTTSTQQRPIIGYYHYDKVTRERQRVLRPKSHPGDGCNYPVSKMYQRKLRTVTPPLWFEDLYLVCVLLSLAQLQWRKRRTPRPKTFMPQFAPWPRTKDEERKPISLQIASLEYPHGRVVTANCHSRVRFGQLGAGDIGPVGSAKMFLSMILRGCWVSQMVAFMAHQLRIHLNQGARGGGDTAERLR